MSNNFEINVNEIPSTTKTIEHEPQQITTVDKKGIDFLSDAVPLGIMAIILASFIYLQWKAYKEEKECEEVDDDCEDFNPCNTNGWAEVRSPRCDEDDSWIDND